MYFLLIIQQLIASGTHIIGKTLTQSVEPSVVLFFRALVVSSAYLIFFSLFQKFVKKIEKKDIWIFILMGLLNIPLNQFLFLNALERTSAPNVALEYALTPAFVLIIARIFLKEKLSKLKTIGVAVAISGTILILSEKGFDFNSNSFQGDIIGLMASFSWALYTIVGRKQSQKYGGVFSTGISMFLGTILYLPMFYFLDVDINLDKISTINWLQILYLGVMTAGVGYAIWYYALQKLEAGKVAVFNNIQPVFTTILAIIFLSHSPTIEFAIGGTLIVGGVILTQKG